MLSPGKTDLPVYRCMHFLAFYRSGIMPYFYFVWILLLRIIMLTFYLCYNVCLSCMPFCCQIIFHYVALPWFFLCIGFNGNEASSPKYSRWLFLWTDNYMLDVLRKSSTTLTLCLIKTDFVKCAKGPNTQSNHQHLCAVFSQHPLE